jgi:PKD repeat protein
MEGRLSVPSAGRQEPLTGPTSGFAPLSVAFTNTSTGYFTSSQWDFGDSQTSTLKNPTHTYEAAGTFTVTLTVSGSGGMDTLTQPSYIAVYPEEQNTVYLPLISQNQ